MTPQNKKELELPASEEISAHQIFETENKHSALEFLIVLAKHKAFILCFVAAAFLLSMAVSLLLPKYYTSMTKIMPPQQGQSISSAMMGELGQLGGLLNAVGGKDLLKNPSELYVAMLRSNTVEDELIKRFDLRSAYGKKLNVDARKRLENLSHIETTKEGVISVEVEDRNPDKAAAMANAYIEELEKLTKNLAITDAGKRRVFFEREAKIAGDQLENAEQELERTQETTGIIEMNNQSKIMMQSYADLRARETALEIEIASMRSFATSENPDLVRLEQQLGALRAQLAGLQKGQGGSPIGDIALDKVPAKALKYFDKLREVTYRGSLLQLLLKQYQAARIDEARDSAIIQVLDPAVPPEKKSSPKRAIIVLSITFLAALVAVLWVLLKETMEHAREDPQYLARLQLFKFYLFRKHRPTNVGG